MLFSRSIEVDGPVEMKLITRQYKNLSEAFVVAEDIMLFRFPSFIYGKELDGKEIPSFCFHSITPDVFEPILQYLRDNDYCTLSIWEYLEILSGSRRLDHPRSVLLTFDDGTGSIWTTVYPLLKKYGFHATVFIIPGRIQPGNGYLPNLEDVWAGKAQMECILKRDASDTPLSTWDEISVMHRAGVIDFESHSYDHSLIFTSPNIVDFVNPAALEKYHSFEFPRIRHSQTAFSDINKLGAPLYTTNPRLSDTVRYCDDKGLGDACVSYVQMHGDADFFKRDNWKSLLYNHVETYRSKHGKSDRYETGDEQLEAIRFELIKSKETIEKYLPGKTVRHLCYPWGVGGKNAREISKQEGYATNFVEDRQRKALVGQDLFSINRISEDFIYCLPGKNKKSFFKVMNEKINRRLVRGSPYLSH